MIICPSRIVRLCVRRFLEDEIIHQCVSPPGMARELTVAFRQDYLGNGDYRTLNLSPTEGGPDTQTRLETQKVCNPLFLSQQRDNKLPGAYCDRL